MAIDDTLNQANAYTDASIATHVEDDQAHPQYVQMVDRLGQITGGFLFVLTAGQSLPDPVRAKSVVFEPNGVWMANEAATAWVKLGIGPIPADTIAPTVPTNFRVTGTTTTTISVAWDASTDTDTGVAGYDVSIDGGAFVSLTNVLSYTFIGLTPASSHTMRVRARDNASTANISASATLAGSTMATALSAPQNLRTTATATTSLTFAWDAPASGTVARYEYRLGGTGTYTTNGTALTRQVTGLTQNTLYTFGVRAVDTAGNTSAETTLSARTSSVTTTPVVTLMGTSITETITGMTWDGYRAYNNSALNRAAAKSPKPKFITYTEGGPNLGGTSVNYTTVFNHCRSVLDTFYYGGTGQTRSANWGIRLNWAIGNENYTKGIITTQSAPNIAQYVQAMKALYDACHYVDPATNTRRYPDAYAGSNPTQFQEQSGVVQAPLHASAQYHDFVMWSMYPSNLGNDGESVPMDWPSLNEADRTNLITGYLIRCFYRTKQAEAQARIDRGDPNYRIAIGAGETGATRVPSDSTARPYWAVHAMWGGAQKLAAKYDLDLPFLHYWDGDTPNRNVAFVHDVAGTNPTTAQAWKNAAQYNHEFGGVHPASWAGNPKASWNTTGPVS